MIVTCTMIQTRTTAAAAAAPRTRQAMPCEHHHRTEGERAAHDHEQNQARQAVVRKRTACQPFTGYPISARQPVVSAGEGVQCAERKQCDKQNARPHVSYPPSRSSG